MCRRFLRTSSFGIKPPRLSKADALGTLIEKFLDPGLNLSPNPVLNADGSVKHKGLDNHAMGTIFEELVRRFNEENNEEAGEHWTPRDAVKLMSNLIFMPIADQIESGTYLLYDGALGTGGMLTVAEVSAATGNAGAKRCRLKIGRIFIRDSKRANPETQAVGQRGAKMMPYKSKTCCLRQFVSATVRVFAPFPRLLLQSRFV
jgi:hypothetical protein